MTIGKLVSKVIAIEEAYLHPKAVGARYWIRNGSDPVPGLCRRGTQALMAKASETGRTGNSTRTQRPNWGFGSDVHHSQVCPMVETLASPRHWSA
jgi:hypothetical protein